MDELRRAASRSHFDFITFTSSSAVHTFMHAVGDGEKAWENSGASYISIGPLTEKALLEYGISSHVPDTYTIEGMLDVMCDVGKG